LLGITKSLKFVSNDDGIKVIIPASLQTGSKLLHTATFKIVY